MNFTAAWTGRWIIVSSLALGACGGYRGNPMQSLSDSGAIPTAQEAAMQTLDAAPTPEYWKQLKRITFQPGFTQSIREMAFDRLQMHDEKDLKDAIAMNLPKMQALVWRQWMCERIAKEKWIDLTPTLVRAWSAPIPGWVEKDEDRPERLALVALHGNDHLADVLVELVANANPVTERNLRMRCWELLQMQGQQQQLVALLRNTSVKPDDALLRDLRRCADELGVVPTTREEILWLQALLTTANAGFWAEAKLAIAQLPEATRATLEIRELPIAVAAARHKPELLQVSNAELFARVKARREAKGSRIATASLDGYGGDFSETLYSQRDKLRWGDLAAMTLAMDLLDDPAMRKKIFDVADRDLQDKTTEFGGILTVKSDGTPELIEMRPRIVGNDLRFEAPQTMFDQGYTGLFHFHMHAQSYSNERYAGPHIGDFTYANSTRANCLVFTFLRKRELNVDYYRHGPLVVDLGSLLRPGTEGE